MKKLILSLFVLCSFAAIAQTEESLKEGTIIETMDLTVSGYDYTHRLTRGTSSRTFGDGHEANQNPGTLLGYLVQDDVTGIVYEAISQGQSFSVNEKVLFTLSESEILQGGGSLEDKIFATIRMKDSVIQNIR